MKIIKGREKNMIYRIRNIVISLWEKCNRGNKFLWQISDMESLGLVTFIFLYSRMWILENPVQAQWNQGWWKSMLESICISEEEL